MTDPTEFTGPFPRINDGGMTLRDYFAGQALAGMLANGQLDRMAVVHGNTQQTAENFAGNCYKIADAMLTERAK